MADLHDINQVWFGDGLRRAWPRVYRFIFNNNWANFIPAINLVAIFVFVSGFVLALKDTNNRPKYLFYVNDIGHIILLLAAWFFFIPLLGPNRPKHSHKENDVGKTVVNFKDWLHLLLIFWILFYICRAIAASASAYPMGITNEKLAQYADYASYYINPLSALAFFGLYVSAEYTGTIGWSASGRVWLLIGIILLGLTLQLIAHASAAPDDEFNRLAGILNGLIVGTTTALLVGRLESKYTRLNKAVITILYCYALIQPLFPYVFQKPLGDVSVLRVNVQYSFVAMALVMKTVFLLSIGKLIDTDTLHFYVSSMEWIDKHAATLQSLHQRALASGSSTPRGPGLFSLVPPTDFDSAKIRVRTCDVKARLGILNAWIGVGWEIEALKATEVQISEARFNVIRLTMVGVKSMRVPEDDDGKFTKVDVAITLDVEGEEFKGQLKGDGHISEAIKKGQKTEQVEVILTGLQAYTTIIDAKREPHSIWHLLESPDLENRLFYRATLDLEALE